jgi:hypothetical protein
MLYSNLDRQGVNLQVDTNLAYFDVTNRRLGVNTTIPGYTLDINGNAHLGNLYILGNTISSDAGANIAGMVSFSGITNATSPVTGTVIVSGGQGIAKDLWVGGNIYASSIISETTSILSIADPLLYLAAGNPSTYNYETGFFGHFVGGSTNTYQHTGLVRNHSDNYWYVFSNAAEPSGSTVNLSNAFIILDTIKSGGLILANTTPSTSTTTGALQVAGGVGIVGALYITNTGDVSANIGSIQGVSQSFSANLGAYQIYANANVGTIYNHVNTLDANIGLYESTTNANIGTIYNHVNTLDANIGLYESTTNANIGTLYLGNIGTNANIGAFYTYANTQISTINANLGAYQIYANANASLQSTSINTINANLGAYQIYANANVGTITNNLQTLTANVGLYEINTNANLGTLYLGNISTNANLGAYQIYANANAASQAQSIATLQSGTYSNANVTAYLPTYTGNLNPGNIVTPSLSVTTLHIDTIYANTSGVVTFALSTAVGLPIGGNIARPSSPQPGQIRFNSDLNALEFYSGSGWQSLNNTVSGQDFAGDGINNTYTLNNSTTTSGILVSINGTVQQPGTAYSVTGNQITFAEVPQLTDIIDIRFLGTATTSVYDLMNVNSISIPVTTSNTIIDSFDSTITRSAKYTISSTTSSDAHMAEVGIVQINGIVVLTAYNILNTGANTINYYANISGTTVRLLANGTTTSNVRVQRTYFSV